MATQPGDIQSVYDFLVALRDDGEFRAIYMGAQDATIDATSIEDESAKQALKTGTSADINAALEAEGKASEMSASVERYIHT